MQRPERFKVIIHAVADGPRRITDLAEMTGVSTITIRRDLAELAEQGALQRTHGGAAPTPARGAEFPFALRQAEHPETKMALAMAAAEFARPGQSILLDNGTTALAVATQLAGVGITALALSLHAAAALARRPGNEIIVPGGSVNPDDLSFTGIDAADTIRSMRFDVAFLGACSADPAHGLTVARRADATIKRAAIDASARTVLVVTADKFTRTSAHRFGSLSDLDTIITTTDAPVLTLHEAKERGVNIVIVS